MWSARHKYGEQVLFDFGAGKGLQTSCTGVLRPLYQLHAQTLGHNAPAIRACAKKINARIPASGFAACARGRENKMMFSSKCWNPG